jgi:hypothetical protein
MIVSHDIKPERDLYFLGGKVIEIILSYEENEIDFFDLFERVNKKLEITISLFTLVLDWLFILGLIKNSKNGLLRICF